MSTPAGQPSAPDHRVPQADPASIRACLSSELLVVFDREWESVLESAKSSKDLGELQRMLGTWRHLAHAELHDPGAYSALLAKVGRIERNGVNPDAVQIEDVRALVDRRLGR